MLPQSNAKTDSAQRPGEPKISTKEPDDEDGWSVTEVRTVRTLYMISYLYKVKLCKASV